MLVASPSGAMDGGMSLESVLLLSRGILGTCVNAYLVIAPPAQQCILAHGSTGVCLAKTARPVPRCLHRLRLVGSLGYAGQLCPAFAVVWERTPAWLTEKVAMILLSAAVGVAVVLGRPPSLHARRVKQQLLDGCVMR